MMHYGFNSETGTRCLLGNVFDWEEYLSKKSDKSLYNFLRRGWHKEDFCWVLANAEVASCDSKEIDAKCEELMKKSYLQLIHEYKETVCETFAEEICA